MCLKKTFKDLKLDYRTVEKILDEIKITLNDLKPIPKDVNIICDATFFRKRKDKDGLLIFRDSRTGRILWFKFIQSETKLEYLDGLNYLKEKRINILSVTIDGKSGIKDIFRQYPVQTCQFHLQANILRKTTLNPQTECGRELKYIATHFIHERWTKEKFEKEVKELLEKYSNFLQEKNESNQYQHRSLRSAFYSIKLALPNLFTYQKYPDLNIPNTANHLDGGVNPKIKRLVDLHRGMSIERRNVLITRLLINLGK